jgi:COP9 signalosome complex subunit 3
MDKIVNIIETFSGDSTEFLEQLQKELKKNQEVVLKNLQYIDAAINSLDYNRHTLGILYLLAAKAIGQFDPETFIHQVIQLIKHSSVRQIRIDSKKFRNVCYRFTELCRDTKQPIRAILPLRQAINKITSSGDLISPQHALFVQACITAKCYKAALPILERFVFKIDPDLTGMESVDARLYFYYGGICYIAMKKFNKALEFFEAVISAPALVVSAIMVEAYKKYVLVSLCQKGEVGNLPRYTNSSLLRLFKQLCPGYEEFANSFSTRSVEDLHKVAENHAEHFIKDGNMGLVKQAIQALYRQNIQRLTKTYITLSLQNITEQVGLPNTEETERRVFRMIQSGQVFATINQKDGMVEFFENPEQFSNNKTLNYLDKQIHDSISLTKVVTKIDEEIALDQKYIQKILQAERGPSRWPGGEGTEDEMGMAMDKPGFHPAGFKG